MIYSLLKFIIGLFIIFLILAFVRTWQMEHVQNQARFKSGIIPNPLPNGLYTGTVSNNRVNWQGKKFDAATASGINLFENGKENQTEKYTFKTSIGKGIRDIDIRVFKIDYDVVGNPWWLRPVLDEIVQVEQDQYLGKLHVRLFGFVWTWAYFELKK